MSPTQEPPSLPRSRHSPAHAVPRTFVWAIAWLAGGIGILLRLLGSIGTVDQPLWRQGDLIAMARAFQREDLNIFHPRVAWRGATTGLVEGEFPLVSWLVGATWRLTGESLWMMRVIPLLSGVAALAMFVAVARRWIRGDGALFAIAFFAVSPLAVFLSSAVQSDGVMLLGIIVTVWAAMHWTDGSASKRWPLLCTVGLWIAGLMKLPALHVAMAVLGVIAVRHGWKAVFRPVVVATLATGIAVPLAWSTYAHTLYNRTGLSLGVSNEHHFAGLELFTKPALLQGIAQHELRYVVGLGVIPIMFAVWKARQTEIVRIALIWLGSVAIMLLVAGRTTGDSWAFYYHAAAVPPVALLVGVGCAEMVSVCSRMLNRGSSEPRWTRNVLVGLISAAVLLPGLKSAVGLVRPRPEPLLHRCAVQLADKLPAKGLILASGGVRLDDGGNQVAYDASYLFQWLDRYGWTIPIEDQNLTAVRSFVDEGAVVFIAESDATSQAVGFETQLRATYPVLGECEQSLVVFDLNSGS
jgi:hypothetical protein